MNDKYLALTYDDGPNCDTTYELLKIFEREDVRASFFISGFKISNNKELIDLMVKNKHLVASHFYSHIHINDQLGKDYIEHELIKTSNLLQKQINREINFFRPPYGKQCKTLTEVCKKIGLPQILWDVDSFDYKLISVDEIVENVVSKVESGSIILMHDTIWNTVYATEKIVVKLKKQGYTFVTVEELYKLRNREIEAGETVYNI